MAPRYTAIFVLATALTSSYAMADDEAGWVTVNDTWCLRSINLNVCLPGEFELEKADSKRLRFTSARDTGPATFLTFFFDAEFALTYDRFPRRESILLEIRDIECVRQSTLLS